MTDQTTTSEVLNRAADLIEERGWYAVGNLSVPWQDDPWGSLDGDDRLCLEGGIAAALGIRMVCGTGNPDLRRCPAYVAVASYLNVGHPSSWNDDPCRTASEVIEALRACAVIEASRERETAEVSA